MSRAMAGRAAAALGLAATLLLAMAAPASAHTIGGVAATNYRSELTSMSPAVPGITLKIRDLGRRVELFDHANQDLIVLGYQGEPYLRVGPAGVFENRRSPSLYQNRITTGNTAVVNLPPEADPNAAPDWHRRGGGSSVSWRDRRVRWEGADPPSVKANPAATQIVVPRWTVTLMQGTGGQQITATGRILWVPGPATWPWFVLTVVLFAGAFVAGMTIWWPTLLSALLAVFLAVDMVRLFGAATQGGGSVVAGLAKALLLGLLEVAAWAGGVWAIGAIQQGKAVGLYAAMAVGVAIGFVSGVGDLLNLAYSQVPSALPASVARAAVAVCLGIGFGIVGGSFLAMRRTGAPELARL